MFGSGEYINNMSLDYWQDNLRWIELSVLTNYSVKETHHFEAKNNKRWENRSFKKIQKHEDYSNTLIKVKITRVYKPRLSHMTNLNLP